MFRKIFWCYVFILTLLDISLNTKLTAQGKSHGATVQDSFMEGVTFQEWNKDSSDELSGMAEEVEGAEGPGAAVKLVPPALHVGRAALAAAHARTVTLTNAGNATLHLTSVAGTTPDFHASFFEAKTLPPQGNTTFSVVYLGRREGPVSAHLYIHTSLGVHKYPVSAVGVASEYDVWPLVNLRIPFNATVEPELTLYNPTDHTIQVTEVYSSGAWLGLRLPDGGERAPRALWAVPPRATRPLVRLRMTPPPAHSHPVTAYVRIKADIPGGGLVVAVEARAAPAGEHARPLQLRVRAAGSQDPPKTWAVWAANSAGAGARLDAGVRGARCWTRAAAAPPPEPCAAAPPPQPRTANGEAAAGAYVSLLRSQLDPYEDFTKVAQLTLDYGELWTQALAAGAGAAGEAWCAGCVRLARAALPYSVRLLPGALALHPARLQFVTAERREALRPHELRATNEFAVPLRVEALLLPEEVAQHFHVEDMTPLSLRPGAGALVARLRLREAALEHRLTLDARAALRTNLSQYDVPITLHSGRFMFEWEWPNATERSVQLGALGAGTTQRVRARLRNPGPGELCVHALGARLHPATTEFTVDGNASTVCVEGGGWGGAWLTVTAPARVGACVGEAWAESEHARVAAALELRTLPGRLVPRRLALPPAAPYAWSAVELVVENSMGVSMDVLDVSADDRAVTWSGARSVARGVGPLGTLTYMPERDCAPDCYTGLDLDSPEGQSWLARSAAAAGGGEAADAALRDDVALLLRRLALFERRAAGERNLTLTVRTTEVVQMTALGSVQLRWPRLVEARAGLAGLAAVGGAAALRLLLRNPARAPLLVHALLADHQHPPPLAGGDSMFCERAHCEWSRDAWMLGEWRVTRGRAARWAPPPAAPPAPPPAHNRSALPPLLLQPDAEVEIKITFSPTTAAPLSTYLFLRNNLTILEGVQLWGQGAVASFEIGGRRPGSASPLLFEVSECSGGGEGDGSGGGAGGGGGGAAAAVVRRSVVVRNTGPVGVRLRDWRLSGRACGARGFRLQPCAALTLQPNDSRLLHLSYAADFTLARAHVQLRLRSELGMAEFSLAATVPAKLLPRCAAGARPPWDTPVRAGAWVLSLTAFILVLVAAVVDAERMLRGLHAVRSPPRPPLDLRALAAAPTAPPPAAEPRPPPRRRRPARRPPPVDPHAERKAFERWRSEMLRRDDDEDSRSSEDIDADERARKPAVVAPPDPCPAEPARSALDVAAPPTSGEEDSISSGSDASTPVDERDETEAEIYEAENEATTREPSPVPPENGPQAPPTPRSVFPASAEPTARGPRQRRERAESLRRARHESDAAQSRMPSSTKHHVRRDKIAKRRTVTTPAPARGDPSPVTQDNVIAEGGMDGGTGGARGWVRSGATWSSVVGGGAAAGGASGAAGAAGGAGATLPPIGSDVRRREPSADQSLFYFNGDAAARPEPDFAWPADRPAFASPPARDYMAEKGTLSGDKFGTLGGDTFGTLGGDTFGTRAGDTFKTRGADTFGTVGGDTFGTVGGDTFGKVGGDTFGTRGGDTFGTVGGDTFGTRSGDTFGTVGGDTFGTRSGDAFGTVGGDTYGTLGMWGTGGGNNVWPWGFGGAPLRPPPGFGAPRSPVRPYDPFRSLASIWAPGAADWRPADPKPNAPGSTPPHPDKQDK